MKKSGFFIKIFAYTIIAMILIVIITAALFSRQFFTLSRTIEREQIITSYQPLVDRVKSSDYNNIPKVAQRFHDNNQSFEFSIIDDNGGVIYATPGADTSTDFSGDFYWVLYKSPTNGYSIIAQTRPSLTTFYNEIIIRALVAFTIILALCLVCAYIFARQITNPIKQLANDAGKMTRLEDVSQSLPNRLDELGDLSRDIHTMYDKLKETISQLENEILRVREMEEAQRYFFSAASHELKTPIAATGVLLEGMLANVGEYKNHPKYLRECVKLMDAQSKLVSEILETVNLIDGKITPAPEQLKLQNVVASVLPTYQVLAERADQQIYVTIPQEEIVFVDGNMLKKVLSNVVLNAVQNAPPGAEIRIWSEPDSDCCRLYVLNTNTHIDEKILPKLFDPFYRTDKVRNRKNNRSGLGLTIVQKMLQAMGADFSLENTDEGVLFRMVLPKA
jgi:two-component system sensor histidine kinase VanS